MGMPEKSTPFDLLLKIDQLYTQSDASLPERKRAQANTWTGIGFRLGSYHFVIAIKDLEEILTELPYTAIPVVKPWIKGVANMRGHLLPVIDPNGLFGITSETTRKQRRVMAVKSPEGGYVGFLVDAVFGMQQFSIEDQLQESPDVPEILSPFIAGVYEREQQKWLIFDTEAFMASPQFLTIGS